jgi:hypothetical protein
MKTFLRVFTSVMTINVEEIASGQDIIFLSCYQHTDCLDTEES